MEAMHESFKTMLTPLMKQLQNRIRKEGMDEILRSDSLLRELNGLESNTDPFLVKTKDEQLKAVRSNPDANSDFKDLKKELQEDPAITIEKNLEVFKRKFEMQKKEIVEEIDKLVVRESDRVIQSVLAGPHEKILDRVSCCYTHAATVEELMITRLSSKSTPSGRTWYVSDIVLFRSIIDFCILARDGVGALRPGTSSLL